MIESYVIAIWLVLSLCAGATVYNWKGDGKEAVYFFWAWPLRVFLGVIVGILVLGALAYFRINYWIRGK